jgi:hypothetical protein
MASTEAGIIVNKFKPYNPDTSNESNIVVIGLNDLGENIVLHAAQEWTHNISQINDERKELKLKIMMVDKDASKKAETLKSVYRHLDYYCEFIPINMEIEPHDFLSDNWDVNFSDNLTRIYLCYDDCSKAVSTAFALSEKIRGNLPLVICLNKNSGLATMVKNLNVNDVKLGNIHMNSENFRETLDTSSIFSLNNINVVELKDVIDSPLQILEDIDSGRLAKRIHQTYVNTQKNKCLVNDQKISIRSWDTLPVSLQKSNLDQARDINRKLKMIGCIRKPLKNTTEPFRFTKNEIKHLAIEEHKRWFNERVRNGWTFDKVSNLLGKKSENLVSWDALNKVTQDLDLEAVESIPDMLISINYEIIRKTDMVRIGVTGHRHIPNDKKKLVSKSIQEVLSRIDKIPQDSEKQPAGLQRSYTIISMLAEGADRLVVKEAFDWGKERQVSIWLEAVLPFDENRYTKTFINGKSSIKEFRELLNRNQLITVFDTRNSQNAAYLEAGCYVAGTCDYLIVIWDKTMGNGKGGTKDIADYGAREKIPRFIIDPKTGNIEDLLDDNQKN